MVILCPSCGRSYDIRGYPIGYTFSCYCGQAIQCPQVMDSVPSAQTPSHPPQPVQSASGPFQQAHSQPVVPAYEDEIDGEATRRISVEDLDLSDLGLESDGHERTVSMMSPLLDEEEAARLQAEEAIEPPQAVEYRSSSQDRLEQYAGETSSSPKKEEEFTQKIDGRAIWAIILFPFVVFGPIVLWVSFSSMRRISRFSEVLKGIWLARFGFLLGLVETAALGAAVFLWFSPGSFPEPLRILRAQVARSLGQGTPIANTPKEPQPATLNLKRAMSLLQQSYPFGKAPSVDPGSFVFQPTSAHHAYLVWRDSNSGKVRQSLFHYSNSKHWHLVTREKGVAFETRVSAAGGDELNEETASSLIRKFWKLRGRFTNVSIHHIAVTQKSGARKAIAYWQLHKKTDAGVKKTNIQTWFYRAHDQKWHLVVYARPLPASTLLSVRKQGSDRMKLTTATSLFQEYWKLQGDEKPGEVRLLHQGVDADTALGCWEAKQRRQKPKNQPFCARFQRFMGGQWLLLNPGIKVVTQLTPLKTRAAELVLGDALDALKVDITRGAAYVYQPAKGMKAEVTWQLRMGLTSPTMKATFHRTVDGTWFLTSSRKTAFQDLRIGEKGPAPLSERLAKELLQKFWRENEKYAGYRMAELYTHRSASSGRVAWGHWIALNGSQRVRMRSQFEYSNQGHWFLKQYKVNPGYSLKLKSPGEKRLSAAVARKILLLSLPKQSAGLGLAPKLQSLYVFQAPKSNKAFVRWVLREDGKNKSFFSLLHRSENKSWYLSMKQILWIPPR